MNITDLVKGQKAIISNIKLSAKLCERLKMLNVYNGATVQLIKVAPFRSGYLLNAGSVRLAVGKSVALNIFVECEKL